MSTFGLYLHIPFCVKKCNYCDFLSFPAKEALKDEYVKALAMEMQLWKDKVSNDAVDTIFIGGGTPSLLTEGQFDVLQNEMVKSFHLSDKTEFPLPKSGCTKKYAPVQVHTHVSMSARILLQSAQELPTLNPH